MPPAQTRAGVTNASNVLEHIWCEMWPRKLCGAQRTTPLESTDRLSVTPH